MLIIKFLNNPGCNKFYNLIQYENKMFFIYLHKWYIEKKTPISKMKMFTLIISNILWKTTHHHTGTQNIVEGVK